MSRHQLACANTAAVRESMSAYLLLTIAFATVKGLTELNENAPLTERILLTFKALLKVTI